MENPNLIACLYPADDNGLAQAAIDMNKASGGYIPGWGRTEPERGSRESTVDRDSNYDPTQYPGIQLAFNSELKGDSAGFVLGRDRNRCDIVLPNIANIGRRHCILTFDKERRLVLRDLSKHGTIVTYKERGGEIRKTIVTYDKEGREKYHHFTWILSGGKASNVKKIVINIQGIEFQIIVSKHKAYPDLYVDNVDQFLQEATADNTLLIGGLGLQSTSPTAQQSRQSGTFTPTQKPIYAGRKLIGNGTFSNVYRVWDVSTGSIYAAKEFSNSKVFNWENEASIMRQVSLLSNEYIVKFVGLVETPSPQLILEYLPLGSLAEINKRGRITALEGSTILCQCLDALTSVHEEGIVHRDIKPENILVKSREPLHIKLSDFGLGKATDDLQTPCGTELYRAPETYTARHTAYYTKACDIWSLAVVVFKYVYGPLPNMYRIGNGLPWCKEIIRLLNEWKSDLLHDLLSTAMLVIKPEKRLPTRECWEQALQVSYYWQSRSSTPTQASYSASDSLKKTSDLRRATPSGTPKEVAASSGLKASRIHSPNSYKTSQGTVNHYLKASNEDDEEEEEEDQQSPTREYGSYDRKSPETDRKRRPKSDSNSTQGNSSTRRQEKRARLEQRDLDS